MGVVRGGHRDEISVRREWKAQRLRSFYVMVARE